MPAWFKHADDYEVNKRDNFYINQVADTIQYSIEAK